MENNLNKSEIARLTNEYTLEELQELLFDVYTADNFTSKDKILTDRIEKAIENKI